jgi:hypothetical protein
MPVISEHQGRKTTILKTKAAAIKGSDCELLQKSSQLCSQERFLLLSGKLLVMTNNHLML